jgi:XTP/dITP diphosphohydrolase
MSDMERSPVLLATRSDGKLRELRPMFEAARIEITDLERACVVETIAEDDLEPYQTFEENALAKARYFHRLTSLPTVADDSGICVVALNAEPGVLSKRWSGRPDLSGQALDDENNRLLLERLWSVADRRAFYVCVAAYVDGARELVCRGEVHGEILDSPRGGNGFGYDPYFFSNELGRTFGEASLNEKERVSHRGRAFSSLVAELVAERAS